MELLRSKHLPMTQQFRLQMSTSPCCQKTNGLWNPVKIHVMVHSVCIPAFDSNARTSGTWCTCFLKIVEAASLRTQP